MSAIQLEVNVSNVEPTQLIPELAAATARLSQRQTAITQSEAALREQRAQLTRMMAELREQYQAARKQRSVELDATRKDNERLRESLSERDREMEEITQRIQTAEREAAQIGRLHEEALVRYEQLQKVLAEREEELNGAVQRAEHAERQVVELEQVHQQVISLSETTMQEHCGELARMMADLKDLEQGAISMGILSGETPGTESDRAQPLCVDRDLIQSSGAGDTAEAQSERLDQLKGEIANLQQQLEAKDLVIQELAARPAQVADDSASPEDYAEYTAAVVEINRQLEADHQLLKEELQQVLSRNTELTSKIKRAEQELSRDRALLGRLRSRGDVDRVLDEISELPKAAATPKVADEKERRPKSDPSRRRPATMAASNGLPEIAGADNPVCGANGRLFAAAAKFYLEILTSQPKLADNVHSVHRYNAACVAALAGSGQGDDAHTLDEAGRTRWREQAIEWLRADLNLRVEQLETNRPEARELVQQTLQHWQRDDDLASLREPAAVARLPKVEQESCQRFWADVAALLTRAQSRS